MNKNMDPRASAMAAQLRAEIGRGQYGTAAKFHRAILAGGHQSDYTTLTKRLNGLAPIPMEALFTYLDVLGVDPEEFFADALRFAKRDAV